MLVSKMFEFYEVLYNLIDRMHMFDLLASKRSIKYSYPFVCYYIKNKILSSNVRFVYCI
jgi:hypothetical protein